MKVAQHHFFPRVVEFSEAERNELGKLYNHNLLRLHLVSLGMDCIQAIAQGQRKDNETAEQYLTREAHVKGKLEVIEALLAIQPPVDPSASV